MEMAFQSTMLTVGVGEKNTINAIVFDLQLIYSTVRISKYLLLS